MSGQISDSSGFDEDITQWTDVGRGPGFKRMKASRVKHHETGIIDGSAVNIESVKPLGDVETGMRVFHQKFGYGKVKSLDGDKLDIEFEKAGRKKVMSSFVEPV